MLPQRRQAFDISPEALPSLSGRDNFLCILTGKKKKKFLDLSIYGDIKGAKVQHIGFCLIVIFWHSYNNQEGLNAGTDKKAGRKTGKI